MTLAKSTRTLIAFRVLWVLTLILRPARTKQTVMDDKVRLKKYHGVDPSQLWNGGQVTEIISKSLTERRRDMMFQSGRGLCECEITSAGMSHDSQNSEILVPDDDLDGPYNFQVIPPTPNKPETSMSEKQNAPKEERSFPHVEDDEIVKYHGARHLNRPKGHPLPYSSLKYGRD